MTRFHRPLTLRTQLGSTIGSLECALFALILVAFLIGCGEEETPPPQVDPDTTRELSMGKIVGFTSVDGAHVWRGLPFAEPPVGDLRWRAPRPPKAWSDTREAIAFGPPCAQFAGAAGEQEGLDALDTRGHEDCLYLNVFAPAETPAATPGTRTRPGPGLPVMLWIHGGGNTIGDALIYDASLLASKQSVVVVTIHYRMGVFGWFSHTALDDATTNADDRSGNFGTLDVIAALQWVRNEISAFGGDPDRVTVFGESAGGSDTIAMLVSPRASGLFHRAIVQSGSGVTVEVAEARNAVDATPAGHARSSSEVLFALLAADGTAKDRDAARMHAADMTPAEIAAYLRAKTTSEILFVYRDSGGVGGMYDTPMLYRDGRVLPRVDPREAFASGNYNTVPAIFGTNRDETKLFQALGSPNVARLGIVPLWFKNERMYDLTAEYRTKMWKVRGVDAPATAIASAGRAPVYAYRFDWDEEGRLMWFDLSRLLGAAHAFEIPFVFGGLSLGSFTDNVFPESSRPAARVLSDRMMSYWGQFAYTGDPSRGRSGSLPPWQGWKPDAGQFIVFDTERDGGVRMSTKTLTRASVLSQLAKDERFESPAERCEVYGNLVRFGRHLTLSEYETIDGGLCKDIPIE